MKLTNKILEAVNRGIQLALDDFDDDETPILNIKSKLVYNRDYTKEYLDLLKYEAVDLGLPSRTLWCKYNLGVNPNLLTKAEDWYGNYYAWGELEPNKPIYDWEHYKFGKAYNLTKYCNDPEYGLDGFTDNLTKLLPEDDVAYLNKKLYNYKFHIPTKNQCEELIKYTNNYWVNSYDPNKTIHNPEDDGGIQGLNGRVFEGKNGNQLFIPAAGCREGFNFYSVSSFCRLWSSSLYLNDPICAYHLFFYSDDILIRDFGRCNGYAVRPVVNL